MSDEDWMRKALEAFVGAMTDAEFERITAAHQVAETHGGYPIAAGQPMPPGQCHPAFAQSTAVTVRAIGKDVVMMPEPSDPIPIRLREISELEPVGYREFRRHRVYQSLDTRAGAYVWEVWVDEAGRQIGGPLDGVEWRENPESIRWGIKAAPSQPANPDLSTTEQPLHAQDGKGLTP